jgi:hypothetical protein
MIVFHGTGGYNEAGIRQHGLLRRLRCYAKGWQRQ